MLKGHTKVLNCGVLPASKKSLNLYSSCFIFRLWHLKTKCAVLVSSTVYVEFKCKQPNVDKFLTNLNSSLILSVDALWIFYLYFTISICKWFFKYKSKKKNCCEVSVPNKVVNKTQTPVSHPLVHHLMNLIHNHCRELCCNTFLAHFLSSI